MVGVCAALRITTMAHFFYLRHFLLLACFSVVAAVTTLHIRSDPTISFALYGALHALALMVTLRERKAIWRKSLCIALAAALSVMSLRIGIWDMQFFEQLSGNAGRLVVAGLSAMIGAVSYAALIRQLGIYPLPLAAFAVIAVACVLATWVAVFTLVYFHSLGRWWLAVLWWYAFSSGLCYCDLHWNALELRKSTD